MSKLLPFMLCCLMTVSAFGQSLSVKKQPSGNGPILNMHITKATAVGDLGGLCDFGGEKSVPCSSRGDVQISTSPSHGDITQYRYNGKTYPVEELGEMACYSCSQVKITGVIKAGGKTFTVSKETGPLSAGSYHLPFDIGTSVPSNSISLVSLTIEPISHPDFESKLDNLAAQKTKEEKSEKENQEAIAKNDNASGSNGTGDKAEDEEQSSSESDQTSGSSSERGNTTNKPRQQSNHQENVRKYNAINRDIANVDKAHNEFNNAIDQVSAGMAEKTRAAQQRSKDWWENEKADAAAKREAESAKNARAEEAKRIENENYNLRDKKIRSQITQGRTLGEYDYMGEFSEEGLAMVRIGKGMHTKCGFVDKTGKEVIPLRYDDASDFSEGLARVLIVSNAYKGEAKYGFIDKNGNEIIPLKYDLAYDFSEGLACVKSNGKYGFINKIGKTVIPFDYGEASPFSEGLAWVELHYKCGFIDKTGKEVIPFKYEFIPNNNSFSEGLAWIKLNGKYGVIDKTGQEIIPIKLEYTGVSPFSEGLANVYIGSYPNFKCGFIDKTGKEAIPLKYDDAKHFSEGLAPVKLNVKWGYIDKSANELIPMKYNKASSFKNGKSKVKLDDREFYIDKTSKEVK